MPYRSTLKEGGASVYIAARNTGKNGQVIFRGSEDYAHFLKLLRRLLRTTDGVSICGFTLLKGSFRLLLHEQHRGVSAKLIQRLSIAYSIYFNAKYSKTGKVFAGPYKDRLLASDDEVIEVLCGFHRLPEVEQQDIEAYQWSSYHYYLAQRGSWIDKTFVETYFGNQPYENNLRHMTSTVSATEAW